MSPSDRHSGEEKTLQALGEQLEKPAQAQPPHTPFIPSRSLRAHLVRPQPRPTSQALGAVSRQGATGGK